MATPNKKVIEQWVSALRSGQYKRAATGGYLRDGDCYCVLGVLADLYVKNNPGSYWKPYIIENFYSFVADNSSEAVCTINTAIQKWAGFDTPLPKVHHENADVCISSLNDNGLSFKELANIIETNYLCPQS